MSLKLERPSAALKEAYLDFVSDWEQNQEEITPYACRLLGRSYEEWLSDTLREEAEAPANFVTASLFLLTDDSDSVLGAVHIRHRLNERLLFSGGHIGYGVRPSERRKGYAEAMLALALPEAKKLGIDRALVTCDKSNLGSAHTILHCGGVLENEVREDGELVQRYWIQLCP
jgi:predicted acetyltransferase